MMGRLSLALGIVVALTAAALAQGGMGPGPGMVHDTGGGGGTVVFDATASGSKIGLNGPISYTHTPVGTPTGVAVAVAWYTGATCVVISSVTYGGNAMTLASSQIVTGQSQTVAIYGLANPPAGAQTVVVNLPATNCFAVASSVTVTGGNTTTVFRASNGAEGSSTTPAVSVTSATGDLVFDMVANTGGNTTLTQSGSQTKRLTTINAGTTSISASTLDASAGSTNMGWTLGVSHPWAHVAVSFQP